MEPPANPGRFTVGVAQIEATAGSLTCSVTSATHSSAEDVASLLATADGLYASLGPGETIELVYTAPPPAPGLERDFVLTTEGYYETGERLAPDANGVGPVNAPVGSFPNPSNPATSIVFSVADPGGRVSIRVFDLSGRMVRTLMNRPMAPGAYTLRWDGTNDQGAEVASGVYFCRMEAPGFTDERKLTLLK